MDPIILATLIGLLCNYRQEKGAREALTHQTFMEWLDYHHHEDLKNLIVNEAALRTEVDNLLQSNMAEMLHKMDEVSKLLVNILSRLDEFKGLAAAVSTPQSELSEQAISLLTQLEYSDSPSLFHGELGHGVIQVFLENRAPLAIAERRFIGDDLRQLVCLGFLHAVPDGEGFNYFMTRNGSQYVKMAKYSVQAPQAALPE